MRVSGMSRPVPSPAHHFVDHPVVVGLDAEQGELLVVPFQEGLAAEPGQDVREADRHVHVVLVHGRQAFLLLPTGREDVVKGHGHHVELVEAGRCRELGKRVDEVVVEPPVAHLTALDTLLV